MPVFKPRKNPFCNRLLKIVKYPLQSGSINANSREVSKNRTVMTYSGQKTRSDKGASPVSDIPHSPSWLGEDPGSQVEIGE